MEDDLNIFENGRQTHIFLNERQPQFFSRQNMKMIFGFQPYFDPTRKTISKKNGRRHQKK